MAPSIKRHLVRSPAASSLKRAIGAFELAGSARPARLERAPAIASGLVMRHLLERLCEDGRSFVDVGAHIGSVVSGVSRHCRPASIHAVEADPDKARRLEQDFPNARIHCCAAGPEESTATFYVPEGQSGNSSLDPEFASRGGTLTRVEVPVRRLDDLLGAADVDIIKLDIEGSELGALMGACDIVGRCRPTIFFESGAEESQRYPRKAIFDWLAERDYDLLLPQRIAHDAPAMSLETFLDAHHYPPLTYDYVAVARSRRAAIAARAAKILKIRR